MSVMTKKKQEKPQREHSTIRAKTATKNKVARFIVGTAWDIGSFYDEAAEEKLKRETGK
jgi:hypothetical protein